MRAACAPPLTRERTIGGERAGGRVLSCLVLRRSFLSNDAGKGVGGCSWADGDGGAMGWGERRRGMTKRETGQVTTGQARYEVGKMLQEVYIKEGRRDPLVKSRYSLFHVSLRTPPLHSSYEY